jgi:hypothetical protein
MPPKKATRTPTAKSVTREHGAETGSNQTRIQPTTSKPSNKRPVEPLYAHDSNEDTNDFDNHAPQTAHLRRVISKRQAPANPQRIIQLEHTNTSQKKTRRRRTKNAQTKQPYNSIQRSA